MKQSAGKKRGRPPGIVPAKDAFGRALKKDGTVARKKGRKPKRTSVPSISPPPPGEESFTAEVIAKFQRICELWAAGKSMKQAAIELGLHDGDGPSIWKVIYRDRALRVVLSEYNEIRAAALYEKAIDWGHEAASLGALSPQGLKIGIDAAFKVAAQLSPHMYGDVKRKEMRGPGGKLIGVETTTDTAVTPAEAYERMLRQD